MSPTVRRMNKEERDFYTAMVARSTSVSLGAPYLTSQIFSLDPFVFDAPADAKGIPVFAVDEQARVYMHMSRIMKAGMAFAGAGLIHEANHVFRNHFDRFRVVAKRYDRDLVNQAEDLEINDDISDVVKNGMGKVIDREGGRGVMKAHYPEINFSPVFPVTYGLKNNQTAEEYLHELQQKRNDGELDKQDSGSGQGQSGDGSEDGESQEGSSPGQGESQNPEDRLNSGVCGGGSGTGDDPADWELGAKSSDPSSPAHSGKSPEELEIVRAKVAQEILDYIKSNGVGSVPAGLERLSIEILAEPQVPWKQVIRGMVLRVLRKFKDGYSEVDRSKRDRRYANVTRIIYPGKKEYIPSIGVGIDSSGSMSEEDTRTAFTEVDSILHSCGVRSSGVQLFTVDAHAYDIQTVNRVEEIKVKGGGGTNMMLCFDAFDKMDIDVGIIMTDGDCYWDKTRPRSRRYTTIVMVISRDASKANPDLFPDGVIPVHVKPSAL